MNKVKGNIKINIINAPTYGVGKKEILDDLAMLTGATIINEDLGDDLDLIQPEHLGTCIKSITTDEETILQVNKMSEEVEEVINSIKKDLLKTTKPHEIVKLEKRLARLSAKIAIVKVGANSEVELKEKKDRVEDAIYAVKAALQEGIVPGGGVALMNAAQKQKLEANEDILFQKAIAAPFNTILENAGLNVPEDFSYRKGWGINAMNGKPVSMIKAGIIDPVLVTKTALKNAVSVVNTIISADAIISNKRINAGD